jgi:broad specificity phosphatase PhoE
VLRELHLVRHGEVHNPDHICYGDLPGFGLSDTGRRQAEAAAEYVAGLEADAIASSPLQRAMETAQILGAAAGLEVAADERLAEWSLGMRWQGVVWERLPEVFPGELEAYFEHPQDLPFSPEPIAAVAKRMAAAVADLGDHFPGGVAVLVSHQDPVQAARLHLTGIELSRLSEDKPRHCSVISLQAGSPWSERLVWHPDVPAEFFPPTARPPQP